MLLYFYQALICACIYTTVPHPQLTLHVPVHAVESATRYRRILPRKVDTHHSLIMIPAVITLPLGQEATHIHLLVRTIADVSILVRLGG